MVFVGEDIPISFLSSEDNPTEAFFFNSLLIKGKCLYVGFITQIKITSPDILRH